MKVATYLALGRVSNLPTVWSNVLAGVVLSGAELSFRSVAVLSMALSLLYVGGMFLNDAFDRNIDAEVHPERPIPSGRVTAREVFAVGFGLLGSGVALLAAAPPMASVSALPAVTAGLALAALIVVYDTWHKKNLIGPLLMGGCRMLVYVTAAAGVSGHVPPLVVQASLVLLAYLIGLTYVAKQETLSEFRNFWPLVFLLLPFVYVLFLTKRIDLPFVVLYGAFFLWVGSSVYLLTTRAPRRIPRAVVRLIAGISCFDALVISSQGRPLAAGAAVACFGATLFLQRYVKGT